MSSGTALGIRHVRRPFQPVRRITIDCDERRRPTPCRDLQRGPRAPPSSRSQECPRGARPANYADASRRGTAVSVSLRVISDTHQALVRVAHGRRGNRLVTGGGFRSAYAGSAGVVCQAGCRVVSPQRVLSDRAADPLPHHRSSLTQSAASLNTPTVIRVWALKHWPGMLCGDSLDF